MSRQFCQSLRFVIQHGKLPLRDRYWRRADGRLRLRYAFASYTTLSTLLTYSALTFFPLVGGGLQESSRGLMVAAVPAVEQPFEVASAAADLETTPIIARPISRQDADVPQQTVEEKVETESAADVALNPYRGEDGQIRRSAEAKTLIAMVQEADKRSSPKFHRLTVTPGDTLSGLLVRAGLEAGEAHDAIKALRRHIGPSDLRPGQTIDLELNPVEGSNHFSRLALVVDPVRTVEVRRNWGGYNAKLVEKPLKRDVAAQLATVKVSLYGSAEAAGVPNSITAEAIRAFSHQIDFQRDIQPGDTFEVMYDRFVTDDGYIARTGGIVFARLKAAGRELSIYRFESRDGQVDYYDRHGQSIRKALLRTPMDGARVSSGFGMRRHPILGYSKMHKGVDFAAPTGTPIYASGDGVVQRAGRYGGYGNYVRIRHNGKLDTAYAHLSRFAKDIKPGSRVKQGQVIGYVGTTGRSTGPHLHYEILVSGGQVNPKSVNLPTMTILEGKDKKTFDAMVRKIDKDFKDRTHGLSYAAADGIDTDSSALLVR